MGTNVTGIRTGIKKEVVSKGGLFFYEVF